MNGSSVSSKRNLTTLRSQFRATIPTHIIRPIRVEIDLVNRTCTGSNISSTNTTKISSWISTITSTIIIMAETSKSFVNWQRIGLCHFNNLCTVMPLNVCLITLKALPIHRLKSFASTCWWILTKALRYRQKDQTG